MKCGASAEAVRILAGHSKLEMTQRYAHAGAGEPPSGLSTGSANRGTSSAALSGARARQLAGNGPAVLRAFAVFPGKFE